MTDKDVVIVEPSEMRLGIIPARTPHDVIVQATKIAEELAKIVKSKGLSKQIQGRNFVYVEGWSTMGAMLGVLPMEHPELAKRFDDGSYEATVDLVRITDGAIIGRASAYVGMDEKDRNGKLTWGSRPEYARKSMAITRATGKAYRLGFSWIMTLAGYEATPAEEMEPIEGDYKEAVKSAPVPSNGKMTLEEAMAEPDSNGKPYGESSTEKLLSKLPWLDKGIHDHPEKKAVYERKEKAINMIVAYRETQPQHDVIVGPKAQD